MLPHGPGSDCHCGVRVHLVLNSTEWAETTPIDMTSWFVFCGFYEVKSSGSQLHGIIFASNINLFIFDVKVMLMHCVLMMFSAHIISQWFLCLKCSLVCVCYGRKRLYHAQARGFVAPNTGDRLCGSTACEWAYKVSLVIQNSPSLMFNARVCQPLLFKYQIGFSFFLEWDICLNRTICALNAPIYKMFPLYPNG